MLELDILTLDFGNDGPGIENPILCLTNLSPEAELRQTVINAKTVVWYRSNRTQELTPHQAFRQVLSDAGTSSRHPKAREIAMKGGLTARQPRDMPQDAAYNAPGRHLKDIHDGDKDTENKENELEEKTWSLAEAGRATAVGAYEKGAVEGAASGLPTVPSLCRS